MKLEIPNEFFNDEELKNTPERFKRFLDEWLVKSKDFNFTTFKNPGYDQIITWSGRGYSICSHHLLPFILEEVHIGYIPKDKICGISKIQRVFNYFSHRPQIQEKLTQEVCDYLEEKLEPKGVICVLKGRHLCTEIRGIRTKGLMTTSAVKGVFLNPAQGKDPKGEFLALIKK